MERAVGANLSVGQGASLARLSLRDPYAWPQLPTCPRGPEWAGRQRKDAIAPVMKFNAVFNALKPKDCHQTCLPGKFCRRGQSYTLAASVLTTPFALTPCLNCRSSELWRASAPNPLGTEFLARYLLGSERQ